MSKPSKVKKQMEKRLITNNQTENVELPFDIVGMSSDFKDCLLQRSEGAVAFGVCANQDFTRTIISLPIHREFIDLFLDNLYDSALKSPDSERALRIIVQMLVKVLRKLDAEREVSHE